jgi:hypothetical protein
MYVARRMPHPLYGSTCELPTFEYRTCKYEVDRSADRSGLPHLSDDAVLPQHRLGYGAKPFSPYYVFQRISAAGARCKGTDTSGDRFLVVGVMPKFKFRGTT